MHAWVTTTSEVNMTQKRRISVCHQQASEENSERVAEWLAVARPCTGAEVIPLTPLACHGSWRLVGTAARG